MTRTVGKICKNGVEYRITFDNTKPCKAFTLKAKYYDVATGKFKTKTIDKYDKINHALSQIISRGWG